MKPWLVRTRGLAGAPAVVAALILVVAAACGDGARPTQPSPLPAVVPGARSGPVTITFAGATPAPGSTIAGCGTLATGCVNRLRMQFRLMPPEGGVVLHVAAFLHATNKVACLSSVTGPLELVGGQARTLEIVFDRADACGVPLTIATMAVVVEGTVQVASRQEWVIAFTLER